MPVVQGIAEKPRRKNEYDRPSTEKWRRMKCAIDFLKRVSSERERQALTNLPRGKVVGTVSHANAAEEEVKRCYPDAKISAKAIKKLSLIHI